MGSCHWHCTDDLLTRFPIGGLFDVILVMALTPSDEFTKPIAEMSPSEIEDWHRTLLDRGATPLAKHYPQRPDKVKVRFDAASRIVVETGVDGIQRTLALRDGKLSRTNLTVMGLRKAPLSLFRTPFVLCHPSVQLNSADLKLLQLSYAPTDTRPANEEVSKEFRESEASVTE